MHSNHTTVAFSNLVSYERFFSDLIWAQHLEISRQFMAFTLGMPLVVRIHGNLEQQ